MQRAGHFTRRLHERQGLENGPGCPISASAASGVCPHSCRRRRSFTANTRPKIFSSVDIRNVHVDWESAALAAGEIDLASLTWGWDDDLAELCRKQYCLARWPDGTPDDFTLRLTAARVFLHLQGLAEVDETESEDELRREIEALLPAAEMLRELDR